MDLFRYPKIYFGFINECVENQSFDFISFVLLIIFIIYFVADLYFLYGALLPFLVEYVCSNSNEIEKTINNNAMSTPLVQPDLLLSSDDNKA